MPLYPVVGIMFDPFLWAQLRMMIPRSKSVVGGKQRLFFSLHCTCLRYPGAYP